ncbi:MAG TPA: 2-amino-4-hydroxy-6-hydroxymethyldihydropteridine diphosphokinase [Candidatus Melainabacteria bacterium]|nr:2-amino-4-hydroxy-6-hydroxymethyldihydropteridine diphosphokinase [Candidatus Melainabacteria bacterium]HIN65145.1 2-amino-4-hydroxy-6-hydroxymethyldihydropteridine diphosphokinase [Candidatus Obscuribacterales bacterium]
MSDRQKFRGNPKRTQAFIGLGSNEGDRLGFVQQSMQMLKDVSGIKVLECSSLYETEPIGVEYDKWFVNAVASVETTLSCKALLDAVLDIEKRLAIMHGKEETLNDCVPGEKRRRVIDLDILFFGNSIVEEEELRVPHPNVPFRAYALVPLLEIAPDFQHPTLKKTVTQLHESLSKPEIVYLYGTRGDKESRS